MKNYILLLFAAFFWGSTFVAQRSGMDYIGPFTYATARNTIGFLFLIPISIIYTSIKKKSGYVPKDNKHNAVLPQQYRKNTIIAGVILGTILFTASSLQQCGIVYTPAGRCGFITALYVILVPLLGLFIGKKQSLFMWISTVLAVIGLYLLCIQDDGFVLGKGEVLCLMCSVVFALHIMVIDYFQEKANPVVMSCIQFAVVSILSFIFMLIFEKPTIVSILNAWLPILYAGILSSGLAYTFQILGQRDTNPAIASLVMSLESVFSVISGAIILHEQLTPKHTIGCIIMFVAIILTEGKDLIIKKK